MSAEQPVDELEIFTEWDSYNTGLLTEKLYRHVDRHEFDFELKSEPGSLLTTVVVGLAITITGAIIYDLAKYLLKRHMRSDLPPASVKVTVDGESYETKIESESDIKSLENRIRTMGQEPDWDDEDDDEDLGAAAAMGG